MNKPKKPLRGLFSRTESAPAPKPEPEPIKAQPQKVEAAKTVAPKAEAKLEPKIETKPVAKVEEKIETKPVAKVEAKTEAKHPPKVEAAVTKIEVKTPPVEKAPAVIAAKTEVAETTRAENTAQRNNDIANAISRVNYNFDLAKNDRKEWVSAQYVEFIRRIDNAQTEAFFLKGKLLEEAKRRFFEDNKMGWKSFCEETLLMNYTTANQYIRVAQEFDVTSHHRPDFGFEHFKALLPLAPEERASLIESLPTVSVKSLRNLVQERLSKGTAAPVEKESGHQAKAMVRLLQDLKKQILECEPDLLPQTQRWQLSAACRNLAEELTVLAHTLNASTLATQRHARANMGAEFGGERS